MLPEGEAQRPLGIETSQQIRLVSAARYDIESLTSIYNDSRVDFMIPMPMSAGKMRSYIRSYDIDLASSLVAVDAADDQALGLALLGLRPGRGWITRLGVRPVARKAGTGRMLVQGLIDAARAVACDKMVIEVVENNLPARRLFDGFGFESTRELLVTRRPPRPVDIVDHGARIEVLGQADALALLDARSDLPSWATESRSMRNAGNISALVARWPDGARGWLAYASSAWNLSRIVIETEAGEPERVGRGLLQQLHWRHPLQDTVCENLSRHDVHWPVMQAMGYMVAFTRVEMILKL